MQLNLQGKVALVTGAGVGIGKETALRLAACGAKVALHVFRNRESGEEAVKQIQKMGQEAVLFQADLTESGAAERLVRDAAEALGGKIDILFNNSGSMVKRVPNAEVTEEYYTQVMDVNFKTTIFSCKAVIPYMKANGGGKIINMASLAAHDGGGPGASLYAASKAAIIAYTKGLAKEVAPYGINVNAVAPGFIGDTPFHETFTPKEAQEATIARIPLGRAGKPIDVAGAVLYLASELSDFLTGETIDINGGVLMR